MRPNQDMRDSIERAAAHIYDAYNDLHFATVAVDLPTDKLRSRMDLAAERLAAAIAALNRAQPEAPDAP